MKKRVYLFLALLLPGLVFVFLKFFGSNRFDIPVYYADSVSVAAPCNVTLLAPYVLPDSAWQYFPKRGRANVAMLTGNREGNKEVKEIIADELGDKVEMVDFESLNLEPDILAKWRSCVFLAESPRLTILFDDQGRIRGYYDIRGLDEVDRLRVELKILLEKY